MYGPDTTLSGSSANTAIVNGHVVVGGIAFGNRNAGSTALQVTVPPPTPQPVLDGPVRLATGS